MWVYKIEEIWYREWIGVILNFIFDSLVICSARFALFLGTFFSFVDSVTLYIRCTLIFPKSLKRADLLATMTCLRRHWELFVSILRVGKLVVMGWKTCYWQVDNSLQRIFEKKVLAYPLRPYEVIYIMKA